MTEQSHFDDREEVIEDEPVSLVVKTYIDQEIRKFKDADDSFKKKKWKNSWRSASPPTKGTFELTASVALATIAYSIFAGFQLHEMRQTNGLTRSALDSNEKTLQATLGKLQGQIDATNNLYGEAQRQTAQASVLAANSGRQVSADNALADATAKQFAANQALIASQAASISIVFGKVTHPVTFHGGAPSIAFSIVLQNSGLLKATHVIFRFKGYYELWGQEMFNGPLRKQRDYCASDLPPEQEWSLNEHGQRISLAGLRDWTVTVEPRRTFERELNFSMGKPSDTEIIKWPPPDTVQQNPGLTVSDRIFPIVIGYVDYQSGAMPEKHQTGFIFEVQEAYWTPPKPTILPYLCSLRNRRSDPKRSS